MEYANERHFFNAIWAVAFASTSLATSACPLSTPSGLAGESVGEKTVVNGLPVLIQQVSGLERSDQVLARVASAWADEKFDVRRQRAGEWDVVSARSAKCTTTLQLIDRSGSFGYFAVSEPGRTTAWLPKSLGFTMPGSVTLNSTVSSNDGGRIGHTITFSTQRSIEDINDYFLGELGRKGWTAVKSHEIRVAEAPLKKVISGQKGREQLSLIVWDDGQTRAVLNVAESL